MSDSQDIRVLVAIRCC